MSRKFLAWPVVPICLFLITIGMRVPNLASLHTPPKPRPRAVIESVCKTPHDATAKKIVALEPCDTVPGLTPPENFPKYTSHDVPGYRSITLPLSGARAPPLFRS